VYTAALKERHFKKILQLSELENSKVKIAQEILLISCTCNMDFLYLNKLGYVKTYSLKIEPNTIVKH
jgi:hypothetical protein